MIALFITIVIFIIIITSWYISTHNKFIRSITKIDESLSGIDVALAKRYDILTKMVEVVKGYSKHEKETLIEVIKLRKDMSLSEKYNVNKKMNEAFEKLNVVVENYPDLKASENYKTLQLAIVDVEEHLQAARRLYNSNVSLYNQLLLSFPSNIVANNMKMKKREFFEANDIEKEEVKIKL